MDPHCGLSLQGDRSPCPILELLNYGTTKDPTQHNNNELPLYLINIIKINISLWLTACHFNIDTVQF